MTAENKPIKTPGAVLIAMIPTSLNALSIRTRDAMPKNTLTIAF